VSYSCVTALFVALTNEGERFSYYLLRSTFTDRRQQKNEVCFAKAPHSSPPAFRKGGARGGKV
jgi:hypothetical protein